MADPNHPAYSEYPIDPPPLEDCIPLLQQIWDSQVLTTNDPMCDSIKKTTPTHIYLQSCLTMQSTPRILRK